MYWQADYLLSISFRALTARQWKRKWFDDINLCRDFANEIIIWINFRFSSASVVNILQYNLARFAWWQHPTMESFWKHHQDSPALSKFISGRPNISSVLFCIIIIIIISAVTSFLAVSSLLQVQPSPSFLWSSQVLIQAWKKKTLCILFCGCVLLLLGKMWSCSSLRI